MDSPDFKVEVNFHLQFLGWQDEADEDEDDFRQSAYHMLRDGFPSPPDSYVQANFLAPEDTTMGLCESVTCDEIDVGLLLSQGLGIPLLKSIHHEHDHHDHAYNLYIALDCQDSSLDMGENGSILVRFQRGLSHNDIYANLKRDLPPVINQLLHTNVNVNVNVDKVRKGSRVIVSVVDPNPSSHAVHQSAMEHNQRLSRVLTETLEKSLIPMAEKLSQFVNVTVAAQSLPFYGQDLSSHAVWVEYVDGSSDYTLAASTAKDLLWNGDLAFVTQGLLSPHVEESFHEDIIQLMLYLPERSRTSMYIETGGAYSTAFAFPEKNVAFSIMNLVHDTLATSVDESILDESYHYECLRAVSQLGSFLRHHFGLSSQQPHAMELGDEISSSHHLAVNHARARNGIAQWELESLMRNTIHLKAEEALVALERVHELIHYRSGISVPEKVCVFFFAIASQRKPIVILA